MTARWTRFESFLLVGIVVTGIGYAAATLRSGLDSHPLPLAGAASPAPSFVLGPEASVIRSELPESGWTPEASFAQDWFEGTTRDGTVVVGPVGGYPLDRRHVELVDLETGRTRVVDLSAFEEWTITRRPESLERSTWDVALPGGATRRLEGMLVAETENKILLRLESGIVVLDRGSVR